MNPKKEANLLRFFEYTLIVYIFSLGLQHAKQLPILGRSAQLSELLFLPMCFCFLRYYWPKRKELAFSQYTYSYVGILIVYVSNKIFGAVSSSVMGSILEAVSSGYLAAISLMVMVYVMHEGIERASNLFFSTTKYLGLWVASTAYLGIAFAYLGFETDLVRLFEHYPYFGTLYRATGLTATPSMLCTVLSFCLVFYIGGVYKNNEKPWQKPIFYFMFFALILSFSKEILLTAWIILAMSVYHFMPKKRVLVGILGILTLSLLIVLTHFIIIKKDSVAYNSILNTDYTSNKIVAQIGETAILASSYFQLKQTAIEACFIRNKWASGIGASNFNRNMQDWKLLGIYPQHLQNYDPHCSFTGALIEEGIIGLSILLVLFYFLLIDIMKDNFV